MKNPQSLQDQVILFFSKELFDEIENKLVFGMVFWIPDVVSGIPSDKRAKGKTDTHPFVVLKYFKESNKLVLCALRTSNLQQRGIYTPAFVLPGLDKPGIIIIDKNNKIDARKFIEFHEVGILPEPYLTRLKNAIKAQKWI